jgi:hypothetical protein
LWIVYRREERIVRLVKLEKTLPGFGFLELAHHAGMEVPREIVLVFYGPYLGPQRTNCKGWEEPLFVESTVVVVVE